MAQDINALIAMAQSRNAQGAFDPNAQPQAQMDQIAMLVRQGLISPQQAQQFMAQIQGPQGGPGQQFGQPQPQANPMMAQAGPQQAPPGGPQSPQAQFPQLNFSNPGPQPNPNTGLPPISNLGIRG